MPPSYASAEGGLDETKPKTWKSTGITGLVLHTPTGTYYHRYSALGKRTYRSLGTKVFKTAKLRLAKKSEDVEIVRQARRDPDDNLTSVGDFEKLLEQHISTSNGHKPASKRNHQVWRDRLHRVWPDFDKKRMDRITPELLVELREKLKTSRFHVGRSKKWRNGYSDGATNQVLIYLKMLFALAEDKKVVFNNPFRDGRRRYGKIMLPQKSKVLKLPSHADMRRIFDELKTIPTDTLPQIRPWVEGNCNSASEMARLLAFSGMRHMEGVAAQWEDILPDGRINVRGTKSETSERIIPIIPPMRELLDEIKQRRVSKKLKLKGRILTRKNCLPALARACRRLGLPHITQHGLRHYFATICIESGVDVPTVAKWLGHADGGAIALKVYGHLRDEHSLAAAQKVTFGTKAV